MKAWLGWVAVLSSCGAVMMGNDAGVVVDAGADAGVVMDAGARPDAGNSSCYWDGGSCAQASDCPCFSSDDCAPTFYCHSRDATGLNVYCEPGARGAGALGVPCANEADCASALCVHASDGGSFCSALCDVAAQCVPALPKCTYVGFGTERSLCSP